MTTEQTEVQEFLSSRSRRQDTLRCPRARWWLHEASGSGFELIRQAVPLVTGVAVHAGCAALLRGLSIDVAVNLAIASYQGLCVNRGLQVDLLETESFVYAEQLALTEALTRLAGLRVVPRLLETYDVLEVETMDKRELWRNAASVGIWRSICDALLRSKANGELYIASWKTCGQLPREGTAAIDMQGVSEAWALQGRLDAMWQSTEHRFVTQGSVVEGVPGWFLRAGFHQRPYAPRVRGVQMIYLIKGDRRAMGKEQTLAQGLTAEQIAAGGKIYKTASPLIWGYASKDFPPKLAWSAEWHCSAPHPMRKSQWYPSGECPGDGRLHKRGDDWTSFPTWSAMGVEAWMQALDQGTITPEAGDALEQSFALPVPCYRTQEHMQSWFEQTQAAEHRIAYDLQVLREIETAIEAGSIPAERLESALNESVLGEQNTESCDRWFGRTCPAKELCWGSDHVRRAPLESGLFQVKMQYVERSVEGE